MPHRHMCPAEVSKVDAMRKVGSESSEILGALREARRKAEESGPGDSAAIQVRLNIKIRVCFLAQTLLDCFFILDIFYRARFKNVVRGTF